MTSYFTTNPAYMGVPGCYGYSRHSVYSGYLCSCGASLDIRYQNSPYCDIEFAGGYCHACYAQIPLYRMRNSAQSPYPHSPWIIDRGYFSLGSPQAYALGPQGQPYQYPGLPPPVNHPYYSPTTHGPLRTQYPNFTHNTSHYQNGYEIPRSIEPRQQWSAGRSEYPRSPLNEETRGRSRSPDLRRHYSHEQERSYSWERSNNPRADDDSVYSAGITFGSRSWTTQATAGSCRSSSTASRSTINCTPSPESDESNIGAGQPCEIEDKQEGEQKEIAEESDEEEPFIVTRDGKFILLGEQWEVPSSAEAQSEAGEPMGYCDITSTHIITDDDGNTTEVEIKEKNCNVSLAVSGGLGK